MVKGKKWTALEDEALARSYMQISEDPINGTDQKSTTFLESITNRFSELVGRMDIEDRTIHAMKNRWTIISHDVSQFTGCIAQIKARNESGKSNQDLIEDAMLLFQELSPNKQRFSFFSCWSVLKDCPKFSNPWNKRSRNEENEDVCCENDDKRPIGRKKLKLRLISNPIRYTY